MTNPAGRRVAVITGGSAGVGRATARSFAKAGFDVAVLARGNAGLAAVDHEIKEAGARTLTISVDVSNLEEVDRAAIRIEKELGPIDVWVNNAMTTVFAPTWDIDHNDFKRAVEVTFLGQVWGTRAALSLMRPRDSGTIINVGSALSFVAIPLQGPYCASKFACRGFTESVRAELIHEHSRVRILMVHLPAVNTPQFSWCKTIFDRNPQPVPPIYQPEIPAQRILKAALDPKQDSVVGSWNRILVVMARLFPRFANQYASLSAWEGQLTDIRIDPGRRSNIEAPVDESSDAGAHGIFDSRATGVADRQFLESLPKTFQTLLRAAIRTVRSEA